MSKILNKKGFTLVELLMALAIVGVIAAFTIGIASSVRNLGKTGETERRMKIIAANTVNFYSGKQEIPRPIASGTGNPVAIPGLPNFVSGDVPVSSTYLSLEQKYRLDGWGQYLIYVMALYPTITINGIDIPPSGSGYHTDANSDIDGVSYNGERVAGVVISLGPNQTVDYTVSSSSDPTTITLDVGSDDIIMPINVSVLAGEIASEELKILQAKVMAFDAVYYRNNDGDIITNEDKLREHCVEPGPPDNSACTSSSYTTVCPPDFVVTHNDPNNGLATLDAIKDGKYSGCSCESGVITDWAAVVDTEISSVPPNDPVPVLNDRVTARISCLNNLANTVMVDPWLNVYVWGGTDLINANDDDRFHKFYSWGPDLYTDLDDTGTADDDDIIP